MLASVAVALAGSGAGAAARAPGAFAVAAPAVVAVLAVGWRLTGDDRLGWALAFGLVFGLLELALDWYHVARLGSFVYRDFAGLRIASSPWYMPLGWAGLTAQFAYAALWIADRGIGAGAAVAATGLAGALLPPVYEQLASAAGAWHYAPAGPRIFAVPLWVPVAYALTMAVAATVTLSFYRPGGWKRAVAGALVTAWAAFPISVAVRELVGG